MLQLTPQSRIFVATAPVDFRKGIDGLAAVCRQALGDNPLEGAVYVFRNRSGTASSCCSTTARGTGSV
jgi:transposase